MKLDGIYKELAEEVGEENALKIATRFGGQYIYLCKLDKLERASRDEAIRKEFTGSNHRELSKKYGLSTQRIRDIVANGDKSQPLKADAVASKQSLTQGSLLEL